MGSSRPLVLSRTFVLDDCNPRSFSSFSLSLSRSSLTGTDSGEVERSQGTRAPLIRHWPLSSALLISPCSLILNCDVFTVSLAKFTVLVAFFLREAPAREQIRWISKRRSQLYARAYTYPSSSPFRTASLLSLSVGHLPFSFLFLPFFLPPPPLPLTGGEKRERKRRRWKMYTVMRPRKIYRRSPQRGKIHSCDYECLLFRETGPRGRKGDYRVSFDEPKIRVTRVTRATNP